ncbi:MAG: hypothetical protein DWG76_07855 [Chloroflexi bacterium]|nr:hypothetical protein [Chloroflexota bacterium]
MAPYKLPTILATSVIRGADKGIHGGVYLIDLESGHFERVLDWNQQDIDWSGRGGARGLRGIAIRGREIYLAASDELFVYGPDFRLLASYRNPHLNLCHEISISGNTLYLTSTGHNTVLAFDMDTKRFTRGYHARLTTRRYALYRRGLPLLPRLRSFDPNAEPPLPLVGKDSLHINNVHVSEGVVYVSGTRARHIFSIADGKLGVYARVPFSAHNAQPHRGGVLINDTARARLAFLDRRGRLQTEYPVHAYPADQLENVPASERLARQGFARGLAFTDGGLLIAGSSPATINVFEWGHPQPLKTITLTHDVTNAIHGLEIWPF